MKPQPAKPSNEWQGPDTISRYCTNKECPHLKQFGRPRFIGYSGFGMAKHKCPDCGQWAIFEDVTDRPDRFEVVEAVAMPT